MRLKREVIWVLFRQADAGEAPAIEATFANPESMARYFVNHDLVKRYTLGKDGLVYPKFTSKQFKFYSLEEVKRKKKVDKVDEGLRKFEAEKKEKEDEDTKEAPLEDILDEVDEERPDADEGDK